MREPHHYTSNKGMFECGDTAAGMIDPSVSPLYTI